VTPALGGFDYVQADYRSSWAPVRITRCRSNFHPPARGGGHCPTNDLAEDGEVVVIAIHGEEFTKPSAAITAD
jgi:hypothetical protein